MRKLIHTAQRRALLLVAALLVPVLLFVGCTDLDENTFGTLDQDVLFRSEQDVQRALAPVYATMRNFQFGFFNAGEHSTDATMVPTRGDDWDDGGNWRQLHQHTWTPTHPEFGGAYGDLLTGVARSNAVLGGLVNNAPEDLNNRAALEAEARALRAFFYALGMDYFGALPVLEEGRFLVDPENPPSPLDPPGERANLFNFVVNELEAAVPDLPVDVPEGQFGRGAALMTLANLYLNAEVYTGTVTESGITPGTARYEDALDAIERLEALGLYGPPNSWWDHFAADNLGVQGNIFSIEYLAQQDLGYIRHQSLLHYSTVPQGPGNTETPWNGFSALTEYYDNFDDADLRKDVFLEGQLYAQPNVSCFGNECFSDESTAPLETRPGDPLVVGPIESITGAGEEEGFRPLKWELDPNQSAENAGNNFVFYRWAEAQLIKAEALIRLNRVDEGIQVINDEVRALVFDPPQPLSLGLSQTAALEAVYNERGFEFTFENKRRSDMIRFDLASGGQPRFLDAWEFKDSSQPFRVLFPIPQSQVDANPNLDQNPGY